MFQGEHRKGLSFYEGTMEERLTYKDYLKVTIPFMISTVTQPLLGAANTAIMGHMDNAMYIAAVALGVIFFNNMYWLFGFLRVATTVFSAQALGEQLKESTSLSFFRPLIIALLISTGFLIGYPWIFDYYASFMHPDPKVIALMADYTDILIWGAPFVLVNYVTLGWLMGQMMIRATMIMQISMNVLNIGLSFLFVFGFDFGVKGVAWASLISQIYASVVGLGTMYLVRDRLDLTSRLWNALKQVKPFLSIMKVNTDLMLRTFCLLTINNLFAKAGSAMGSDVLATNAVILEIIFIMAYFTDGQANGVSVFTGKAFGKRDLVLWKDTLKISLQCLAVYVVIVEVVLGLFRNDVIMVMTSVPEIYTMALEYSHYLLIYPICAAVGLLLYGMYNGIGQTASIRNMMFIAVVFFVGMQELLIPPFGNDGIWMTYVLTYLLESIILVLFLPLAKKRFSLAV